MPRRTKAWVKEQYQRVIDYFSVAMPDPKSELNYRDNFELLVAVILSAQCTDVRVNKVTPALFQLYPTPDQLAQASEEGIYELIASVSYPNAKAKHLKEMAMILVERFHSEVPEGMEELMSLPGVGRKTANVVRSVAFNIPALPVDTHVFRVAKRLGLTQGAKNPDQTERQLTQNFPMDKWSIAHHWLLLHGRYVCLARKPKCDICGLAEFCPRIGVK